VEKANNKAVIDPVGMIMLVFVGLLLQESTSGLLDVWERISGFGYEHTLLVIAILFYWLT